MKTRPFFEESRCSLAHQVGGIVKQGQLSVSIGLSEHRNLPLNPYAS